jgi:hypothetical protein
MLGCGVRQKEWNQARGQAMSEQPKDLQSLIDEDNIRLWFYTVDLEQAEDTYRVVDGILQGRRAGVPARKKRADAGKPRKNGSQLDPFDEPKEYQP